MLRPFLLLLLAAHAALAAAEGIEVSRASVDRSDEAYVLNADFDLDLRPRHEDAIDKGLALYFVVEFELTRSRWYWFDEKLAAQRLQLRIAYQPITRQYRAYTGTLYQNFATLEEALRTITHIRGWPVTASPPLKPDQTYLGALRLRLDVAQLPKPFQVDALTNRDWILSSDWKRWQFTTPPEPPPRAPVKEAVGKPVQPPAVSR